MDARDIIYSVVDVSKSVALRLQIFSIMLKKKKTESEKEADRKLDEHCAIKFMETINMF